MTYRMLSSGLIAGFVAGLFAAMLHLVFVQELILLGEDYETGAAVHFMGTAGADADAGHTTAPANAHQTLTETTTEKPAAHSHDGTEAEGHSHAPANGAEPSPLQRNGLTVLFTALIYAAYGLLMAAGFALAEHFGHRVVARDGILWGVAGFAAFALAPSLGLAPELPGTPAADLQARQIWWLGTIVATLAGLGMLAFGRGAVAWIGAALLLAAPHVIGAPHPDGYAGLAPPEVAAGFSARVLGVGLMAWAALGTLTARMWTRSTT